MKDSELKGDKEESKKEGKIDLKLYPKVSVATAPNLECEEDTSFKGGSSCSQQITDCLIAEIEPKQVAIKSKIIPTSNPRDKEILFRKNEFAQKRE